MHISENAPVPVPSDGKELSVLADDVFKHPLNMLSADIMGELHDDIKIAIEEGLKIHDEEKQGAKLYQIRGMLLSAIDMLVDEGTIPKEEAVALYERLGLSAVERSRIRGASA